MEPPNVIFLFILKKGMGESNVVVLHMLVTCAKSYGCAYGPTCAYGPDRGGGAKKVLTVQLGNETTDNSKRQGNKEDRQEIGYARFQESLQKLATCQE